MRVALIGQMISCHWLPPFMYNSCLDAVRVQVNAAQLGLVSIACFNEWRNGGDVRNDRVKAFAIGSGVLAVGLAVRASQAGSGGTAVTV